MGLVRRTLSARMLAVGALVVLGAVGGGSLAFAQDGSTTIDPSPRPIRPHPALSDATKQCLAQQGIQRPAPGTRPRDADRAALRAALTACGVTLPDGPPGGVAGVRPAGPRFRGPQLTDDQRGLPPAAGPHAREARAGHPSHRRAAGRDGSGTTRRLRRVRDPAAITPAGWPPGHLIPRARLVPLGVLLCSRVPEEHGSGAAVSKRREKKTKQAQRAAERLLRDVEHALEQARAFRLLAESEARSIIDRAALDAERARRDAEAARYELARLTGELGRLAAVLEQVGASAAATSERSGTSEAAVGSTYG